MSRKKMTIRPPGLAAFTAVLFAWVIAPVVVGMLILIAGYFALFH